MKQSRRIWTKLVTQRFYFDDKTISEYLLRNESLSHKGLNINYEGVSAGDAWLAERAAPKLKARSSGRKPSAAAFPACTGLTGRKARDAEEGGGLFGDAEPRGAARGRGGGGGRGGRGGGGRGGGRARGAGLKVRKSSGARAKSKAR